MSYQSALMAAGAHVLDFETYGSYQGDWCARVVYNGKFGYVVGSFGSCSHCDAFEGEFGYGKGEDESDEKYDARLADFGRSYLIDMMDVDAAIKWAEQIGWNEEGEERATAKAFVTVDSGAAITKYFSEM